MHRKSLFFVIGSILVILVFVILYSIMANSNKQNLATNTIENTRFTASDEPAVDVPINGTETTIQNTYGYKQNTDDIPAFSIGETFNLLGLDFVVNGWEITKEKPSAFPMPQEHPAIEYDQYGNLTNNTNYMIVNMTIENNTDASIEYYSSGFTVYYYDENLNDIFGLSSEVIMTNKMTGQPYPKDYFHALYEPKTSTALSVVFLVEDSFVTEDTTVEFIVRQGGYPLSPEAARVVVLQGKRT